MKGMSCSLDRSCFGTFWVILLSFLVLSFSVQFSKLNQNVLAQAASLNQRGQSETNRLNLPDREGADKPSFKRLIPQAENMSPTSIGDQQLKKSEVIQKTAKLQMPFIANEGQTDEKVAFYANTFGGTVFVTKDGNIVYSLPHTVAHATPLVHYDIDKNETGYTGLTGFPGKEGQCIVHRALCTMYAYCTWNFPVYYSETNSPLKRGTHPLIPSREGNGVCNATPTTRRDTERRVPTTTVALKEEFVGANVKAIQGEQPSVTKVNYFKGSDPEKWKTNISTYDVVSLGEVYDGIELKLKAYGNNVEKLFCVKSGANPEQIKISLSGIQPSGNPPPLSPSVRGTGGCPPLAGAGGGLGARGLWVNDEGQLVAETELGPVKFTKPIAYQEINGKRVDISVEYRIQKSELNPKSTTSGSKNPKSAIHNPKLQYGFKVASYDKSHDLIIDPLLASTYLGGSGDDWVNSLTLDASGNVYVTGWTGSTDFPTMSGAYDTSFNGAANDAFVFKLDGGLTSLLASTYLGGSGSDSGNSLTLDTSGNVYVTGNTESENFPTTRGAYDTSFDSGYYPDVFVTKLDSTLTSLLASTYLGGSNNDYGNSLALDTSGNVYVTGQTTSSNFPTTSGAYDTSYNSSGDGYADVFISKLDSGLTSLLSSTYLGGSEANDEGRSLFLDTSGNVYVTGWTYTTDFPTTSGAYNTSSNGKSDVFASKLDGELTILLASTYLGGSGYDGSYSLTLDTSGNVYVTGYTESSDFPTTSGAYDTSFNGDYDVFVSKLDSGLTSLLASTYLGGSSGDSSNSLALDTSGNVYVPGYTESTDFPTTSGAYDTSYNGNGDVFVSKLDSNLSASTTFTPIPTLPPLPTPVPSPSLSKYGQISGYVYDMKGNPVESVKIRLKRPNSRVLKKTFSDEEGFFEFTDLYADTYIITAIKKGYKTVKQTITLESGEEKDIEIVTKKTGRKRTVKDL